MKMPDLRRWLDISSNLLNESDRIYRRTICEFLTPAILARLWGMSGGLTIVSGPHRLLQSSSIPLSQLHQVITNISSFSYYLRWYLHLHQHLSSDAIISSFPLKKAHLLFLLLSFGRLTLLSFGGRIIY
jgi:hypothetical protein